MRIWRTLAMEQKVVLLCSLHHYPKLIYGADFLDGKTMSFSPYLIPQPNFVRRAGWGMYVHDVNIFLSPK